MSRILLGIERIDEYLDLFKDKKVGLITNHTGLDQKFNSSIDILRDKVNLTCLFAPEHGIRGNIEAGEKYETYFDEKTNLPVYSLYGASRRPSKEMLDKVDVIAIDIQDVGARFYTYIYTMAYAMMSAAENNKEFIVFDRPNPVGSKVEGNILNLECRSFVGYYPLAERHGMTIGELALMFNYEFNINAQLTVIKNKHYHSDSYYSDLPLKWVSPSPNIPTIETCFYYLITCYLEGTNVSEGRGTSQPFKVFGSPWLKTEEMIKKLNEYGFKGVSFRKTYFTPYTSKHKGTLCNGIEIYLDDVKNAQLVKIGMTILFLLRDIHEEFSFNLPYPGSKKPMIDYLVGDDFIRLNSLSLQEVFNKIDEDTEKFIESRKKYQLYG